MSPPASRSPPHPEAVQNVLVPDAPICIRGEIFSVPNVHVQLIRVCKHLDVMQTRLKISVWVGGGGEGAVLKDFMASGNSISSMTERGPTEAYMQMRL